MAAVPGATATFSQFIQDLTFEAIPPEAVHGAKVHILDTIGNALAAANEDAARIARGVIVAEGCRGACSVLGTDLATSASNAAFANGLQAHALDFDDWGMSGHPSCMLVAASLAAGQQARASGRDLIASYLAGLEVYEGLGRGCAGGHARGWHTTPVFGALASAGAAGKLFGLAAEQLAWAIAIASSAAGGISRQQGTMVKPFHGGNAARSGVTAALLAGQGFTGDTAIIESKLGFGDCFFGPGSCDYEAMVENLGNPFRIVSPGISLKPYPCSYPQFRAANAALSIALGDGFRIENVDRVDVRVTPWQAKHVNPKPDTGLRGKFSVNYVVAASLVDKRLTLRTFDDASVARPDLEAMLAKVHVELDHSLLVPGQDPNSCPNVVSVRLKDETVLREEVSVPTGHYTKPLTDDEVRDKFLANASVVYEQDAAGGLCESLMALEKCANVRELFEDYNAHRKGNNA
jgi:2-methylcitrate dehydratase PrpD